MEVKDTYCVGNGSNRQGSWVYLFPTEDKEEICGTKTHAVYVSDWEEAKCFDSKEEAFEMFNKQPKWFKECESVYRISLNSFGHWTVSKVKEN